MKQTFSITRKELDGYFGSPMALIFVSVFLAITMFTFFWIDGFWQRGVADVRSLFRWMPLLLVFLVSALTMRQWSEEQQSGTLEVLLTLPIRLYQLVIGKFLAVLGLVALALAFTLVLPITVSMIGNLDVGPVVGGYIAALLMASAYIAIGLFVSSRTDNQIVSLIVTAIIAGGFHLVGTSTITELFDTRTGEFLRDISTSGRFESIERGVLDIRDLLYYITLTVIFLALNILSLDARRWGMGMNTAGLRLNRMGFVGLLTANLLIFNVLMSPVTAARADLTENGVYSLSEVTENLLGSLQEPLLIRFYASEENHPLLQPLIPIMEDTLEEYRIAAGSDNLEIDVIDPIDDPEIEQEANSVYGIRPLPAQIVDRAGSEILNIYFDILIRYGDQTEILNFQDLVEVDAFGDADFEVRFRNLEYDLTNAIQKTVFGFQSIESVLASVDEPARLTFFVTPETLPDVYAEVPATVERLAGDIQNVSNGNFTFETVNVDLTEASNAEFSPQFLFDNFGIQPIPISFLSSDVYYMHMLLEVGNEASVIFPSGDWSETEIRSAIEAALRRSAPGFLQVVGVWVPSPPPPNQFGQQQPTFQQYFTVVDTLAQTYDIRQVDLSTGFVQPEIDTLFVIAPQGITDVERYAIDQFLMRGGALFVTANDYRLGQDQTGNIALEPIPDGLTEMLGHYGVSVGSELVVDLQNEPFPIQQNRDIGGGVIVQEVTAINYPHFVDIRPDGMAGNSGITTGLSAVTVPWGSPVTVSDEFDGDVTVLLESSDDSWLRTDLGILPDDAAYPRSGYAIEGDQQRHPLAVSLVGQFESFFAERPSPFEQDPEAAAGGDGTFEPSLPTPTEPEGDARANFSTITESPSSARLVVVGSSEFLNDNIFSISTSFSGDRYLNTLQFAANSVDWFVEDTQLASIRGQGNTVRLLDELTETEQRQWEIINYVVALLSVVALGGLWLLRRSSEQPMELTPEGDEA